MSFMSFNVAAPFLLILSTHPKKKKMCKTESQFIFHSS